MGKRIRTYNRRRRRDAGQVSKKPYVKKPKPKPVKWSKMYHFDLDLEIKTQIIKAKANKLKAVWTQEAAKDLDQWGVGSDQVIIAMQQAQVYGLGGLDQFAKFTDPLIGHHRFPDTPEHKAGVEAIWKKYPWLKRKGA